jgi:hypothetical protein
LATKAVFRLSPQPVSSYPQVSVRQIWWSLRNPMGQYRAGDGGVSAA